MVILNWLEVLGTLENPRELWNTFKYETLQENLRSSSGVALREMLENMEELCCRVAGDLDLNRTFTKD